MTGRAARPASEWCPSRYVALDPIAATRATIALRRDAGDRPGDSEYRIVVDAQGHAHIRDSSTNRARASRRAQPRHASPHRHRRAARRRRGSAEREGQCGTTRLSRGLRSSVPSLRRPRRGDAPPSASRAPPVGLVLPLAIALRHGCRMRHALGSRRVLLRGRGTGRGMLRGWCPRLSRQGPPARRPARRGAWSEFGAAKRGLSLNAPVPAPRVARARRRCGRGPRSAPARPSHPESDA